MIISVDNDVEFHTWPPYDQHGGQHTNSTGGGILALHTPTGVAVVRNEGRSQLTNLQLAREALRLLLLGCQ